MDSSAVLVALHDLERLHEPLFVRVLRALSGPAALSGRQVARALAVAPHTAIDCLEMLRGVGGVTKRREGSADLWELTDAAVWFLRERV